MTRCAAGMVGLVVLLTLGPPPALGEEYRLERYKFEWVVADMAIMRSGGATTTVYPTALPDEVAYILSDSDSQVVIAEDAAQVERLTSVRDQLPHVRAVAVMDGIMASSSGRANAVPAPRSSVRRGIDRPR